MLQHLAKQGLGLVELSLGVVLPPEHEGLLQTVVHWVERYITCSAGCSEQDWTLNGPVVDKEVAQDVRAAEDAPPEAASAEPRASPPAEAAASADSPRRPRSRCIPSDPGHARSRGSGAKGNSGSRPARAPGLPGPGRPGSSRLLARCGVMGVVRGVASCGRSAAGCPRRSRRSRRPPPAGPRGCATRRGRRRAPRPKRSTPRASAAPVWRVASLASDATVQIAQGEVGKRTMLAAPRRRGLPRAEAFRRHQGVRGGQEPRPRRRRRTPTCFAKDCESGKVVAFEYASSPVEVWQARDHDGMLEAKKVELPVEEKRVAVGVSVGDDLRASVVQAGLDDDVLKMLDDALEGHAELADLRPGARLRLVATEDRIEGVFARYAALDAVEYTPANPRRAQAPRLLVRQGARPARRGRTPTSAASTTQRASSPTTAGGGRRVPLARIASRFNPHRMHPSCTSSCPTTGSTSPRPRHAYLRDGRGHREDGGGRRAVREHGPDSARRRARRAPTATCRASRRASTRGSTSSSGSSSGTSARRGAPPVRTCTLRSSGGTCSSTRSPSSSTASASCPPRCATTSPRRAWSMDLALEAIPMPAPMPGRPRAGDGGRDAPEETVFDDSPGLE